MGHEFWMTKLVVSSTPLLPAACSKLISYKAFKCVYCAKYHLLAALYISFLVCKAWFLRP